MPVYNGENFISEAIESVLSQNYNNLEIIITDDYSTDGTEHVVKRFVEKDSRVKYYKLNQNQGAAVARNNSIEKANGKYLAFLDSDDLWKKDKLEKQIGFMQDNGYTFTCTSYGKIDDNSNVLDKVCRAHKEYEYNDMLKWCPGNSTVVYDCETLGKVEGPKIRKRNDFAMFLQVIKRAGKIYGMEEMLGYHRVRNGSISVNKRKLVAYQWKVYYEIEKLGVARSAYYTGYKVMQTLMRQNG
jgi:glycosyltransferase involved in cell wall biosynthesis